MDAGKRDLLDQPEEIGRRLAAAVGYSEENQSDIADRLAFDERTLRNYYDGGLEAKSRAQREAIIEEVVRETGCPPDWFGLSAPEPREVDRLRQQLRDEMKAMKVELLREIEKVRRAQASPPSSEEPGAEG